MARNTKEVKKGKMKRKKRKKTRRRVRQETREMVMIKGEEICKLRAFIGDRIVKFWLAQTGRRQ